MVDDDFNRPRRLGCGSDAVVGSSAAAESAFEISVAIPGPAFPRAFDVRLSWLDTTWPCVLRPCVLCPVHTRCRRASSSTCALFRNALARKYRSSICVAVACLVADPEERARREIVRVERPVWRAHCRHILCCRTLATSRSKGDAPAFIDVCL